MKLTSPIASEGAPSMTTGGDAKALGKVIATDDGQGRAPGLDHQAAGLARAYGFPGGEQARARRHFRIAGNDEA
jgi:hypothetical protein